MRLMGPRTLVAHRVASVSTKLHHHTFVIEFTAVFMEILDILSEHHTIRLIAVGGYIGARALNVLAAFVAEQF